MASASNQPVLEKEIVLISGGVESTTMLHMRYRTVTTALQQNFSVTTALQHENARVDRPTIPYSVKDLIVPLFINYGEDFQQDFFTQVLTVAFPGQRGAAMELEASRWQCSTLGKVSPTPKPISAHASCIVKLCIAALRARRRRQGSRWWSSTRPPSEKASAAARFRAAAAPAVGAMVAQAAWWAGGDLPQLTP